MKVTPEIFLKAVREAYPMPDYLREVIDRWPQYAGRMLLCYTDPYWAIYVLGCAGEDRSFAKGLVNIAERVSEKGCPRENLLSDGYEVVY